MSKRSIVGGIIDRLQRQNIFVVRGYRVVTAPYQVMDDHDICFLSLLVGPTEQIKEWIWIGSPTHSVICSY